MNKYKYLVALIFSIGIAFVSSHVSNAETLPIVKANIVNSCAQHSIGILAAGEKQDTKIGEKNKSFQLPGRINHDYRVVTCTAKSCYMHGVVSMRPGGVYTMEVSNCIGSGADISLRESILPSIDFQKSLIRFRANRIPQTSSDSSFMKILEYRPKISGFSMYRRLGLGFTSYKTVIKNNQPKLEVRIRIGKNGPIVYKRSISLKMVNNRKYLVEVSYKEERLFFKIVDEGWIE